MLTSLSFMCFVSLMLCSYVANAMPIVAPLSTSKSGASPVSRSLLDSLDTDIDDEGVNLDLFSIKKTFRPAVSKHNGEDDLPSYLEPVSDWMQDCNNVCDDSSSSDDSSRFLGTKNKHSKSNDDENHCCKGGISFLKFHLQGNTQGGWLTIDSDLVDCSDDDSDDDESDEYHPNYRRMTTYERKNKGGGKKGSYDSGNGSRDSNDSNDYHAIGSSDDSDSSDSSSDSYDDYHTIDSKDDVKDSHSSDNSHSSDESHSSKDSHSIDDSHSRDDSTSSKDESKVSKSEDKSNDHSTGVQNVRFVPCSDSESFEGQYSKTSVEVGHSTTAVCIATWDDGEIDYTQDLPENVHIYFESDDDVYSLIIPTTCNRRSSYDLIGLTHVFSAGCKSHTTPHGNFDHNNDIYIDYEQGFASDVYAAHEFLGFPSNVDITLSNCGCSCEPNPVNPTVSPTQPLAPNPNPVNPTVSPTPPLDPNPMTQPTSDARPNNASPTPPTFMPLSIPTRAPLGLPSGGLPTHTSLIPISVAPSVSLIDSDIPTLPPLDPTSQPTDLVTILPTTRRPSIDSTVPIESSAPSSSPTNVLTSEPSAPSSTTAQSIDPTVSIATSVPSSSPASAFTLSPSAPLVNPTGITNPTASPLSNTVTPSALNLGPSQFRFPTRSPTLVLGPSPTTFQETPLPSFSSQEEVTPDPSALNLGPSQFRFPTPSPMLVLSPFPTTFQGTPLPSFSSKEEVTPVPSVLHLGPSQFQFRFPTPSPMLSLPTPSPSFTSQDNSTPTPTASFTEFFETFPPSVIAVVDPTAPTPIDRLPTSLPSRIEFFDPAADPFPTSSPSETGATLFPSFSFVGEITDEPTSPRQGGPAGAGTPSPSVGPVDCEDVCGAWAFENCGLVGDNGYPIPGVPCDVTASEMDGEGRRRHLFEYHTILTELLALLDDPTSI